MIKNKTLFDIDSELDWKKEWVGMPEFNQKETSKPYAEITFRFASEDDLKEFSKLIGQKLTKKTKSAWHPQIIRGINANKIYVYEP
jgi:hypothetical protein